MPNKVTPGNLIRLRGRRALPVHSSTYLSERIPEPLMGWDRIRMAKIHCDQCRQFEWWSGGCRLNLLPNECNRED